MKIWFTCIAGSNSLNDLKEMWEPIKGCFEGIVCTYHGESTDLEAQYLEQNKGKGKILYLPYVGRHDHSRNTALWCGPIQQDDWVVTTDILEHLNSEFAIGLPFFLKNWEGKGANAVFYYGKPLAYKYHESMRYAGTPHEALQRQDGQLRGVEISDSYPNEADVRLNVRPQKRPPEHFIKHYAKYSLLPWGANHYMLGLENNPKARELFMERELGRLKFIEILRELNIGRDVDSVIEYLRGGDIDQRVIRHIENDKPWNDVYRYYILGRFDFKDDHDWTNLVKIKNEKV